MKAIWQMWESALDDHTIQRITKECMTYNPMEANIGHTDQGVVSNKVRQSTVRWINPLDINSVFITHLLWKYVREANRNVFGVEVSDIFDIQYTIYDGEEQGHYDWHFDTFWANNTEYDRKLSITIQLSDPNDYEGGDFIIDPQYEVPDKNKLRKKGTVFVFPSPIRHKVSPVKKGIRKSLVAWVEGPKWK